MDGRLWFRIEGSAMSLSSKRTMTDADGERSPWDLSSYFEYTITLLLLLLLLAPPHDHQVGRWPATRRSYSACTPLPTSLFRTEVGFSEFVYTYSQCCSGIVIHFDILTQRIQKLHNMKLQAGRWWWLRSRNNQLSNLSPVLIFTSTM